MYNTMCNVLNQPFYLKHAETPNFIIAFTKILDIRTFIIF